MTVRGEATILDTMRNLIRLLNEMRDQRLIRSYALGGATALVYYLEPVQTQDVHVFVVLSETQGELVNLAPLYRFFADRGVHYSDDVRFREVIMRFGLQPNLEALRRSL